MFTSKLQLCTLDSHSFERRQTCWKQRHCAWLLEGFETSLITLLEKWADSFHHILSTVNRNCTLTSSPYTIDICHPLQVGPQPIFVEQVTEQREQVALFSDVLKSHVVLTIVYLPYVPRVLVWCSSATLQKHLLLLPLSRRSHDTSTTLPRFSV